MQVKRSKRSYRGVNGKFIQHMSPIHHPHDFRGDAARTLLRPEEVRFEKNTTKIKDEQNPYLIILFKISDTHYFIILKPIKKTQRTLTRPLRYLNSFY
jgi:hypothetical protein